MLFRVCGLGAAWYVRLRQIGAFDSRRCGGSRTYFLFMTIVIWLSPIGPLAARFSVITLPSGE